MKSLALLIIFVISTLTFWQSGENCSSAGGSDDLGPERLVVIKGKAMFLNFPEVGKLPATSETLIFQKVGCEYCLVATKVDSEGNYKIIVGDGRYKLIVRNPSSPEIDWLAPNQERFVDTTKNSLTDGIYNFDINIKVPD